MTLAAFILAGGSSQRMGQDKALLELEGVPMLRRTWEVARQVTPAVWVVTPRQKIYRPHLPPEAQWISETPDGANQPPGPLVAFEQALSHLQALSGQTPWVLLLSCDMPALQAAVLQAWRRQLGELSPETVAYLPQTDRGWESLCGFYRTACLPSLQACIHQGERSFQGWLASQSVQAVAEVPTAMLLNCNTPEDWAAYQLGDRR